jgi:hypothetical protein
MKIFLIALAVALIIFFLTMSSYTNMGSGGKVAGWPVRWHIEKTNDFGNASTTSVILNYIIAIVLNILVYWLVIYFFYWLIFRRYL